MTAVTTARRNWLSVAQLRAAAVDFSRHPLVYGAVAAWLLLLALALQPDVRSDAHTYWFATQPGIEPYGREWSLELDAYVYPPPFLQVMTPLGRALDWPTFHLVWTIALMLGVLGVAGPVGAVVLLLPIRGWPVWESVIWGNVEIPMTLALLLSLRHGTGWLGIAFTKVTPAAAVTWHIGRREWRHVARFLAASAGIIAVSVALQPHLWAEWFGQVVTGSIYRQPFAAPLVLRVILGATLAYLGGVTDRRWVVPIAVVVAHPAIWFNTLAIPMLWLAWEMRHRPGRSTHSAGA